MIFLFNILIIEFITQPVSSITVKALEDVTLTCSASVDDVTYSWHRVNHSIPSRSMIQNNTNTLTIVKATPYDEGVYYCMASKEGIIVESDRAIVKVDGKECIIVSIIVE